MAEVTSTRIKVVVVYALSELQEIVNLELPKNSTVIQAIEKSGILQKYKEIDLSKNAVGIYGKIVELDNSLQDYDRVEIYRPLAFDPVQARRVRANLQKQS